MSICIYCVTVETDDEMRHDQGGANEPPVCGHTVKFSKLSDTFTWYGLTDGGVSYGRDFLELYSSSLNNRKWVKSLFSQNNYIDWKPKNWNFWKFSLRWFIITGFFLKNPIQSRQALQSRGPWTDGVRQNWVLDIWTALIVSYRNINPWDDHIFKLFSRC